MMLSERQRARSVLLVGYGNPSRRDDGVAEHILRRLLGKLGLDDASLEEEIVAQAEGLGMVCLHQLAPELAETVAEYDVVVFIDAHVEGVPWDDLSLQRVEPVVEPGMLGHHLKAGVILALCETLYDSRPEAYLLSVLGHDFDFGDKLSAETSRLADEAVERLIGLLEANAMATNEEES